MALKIALNIKLIRGPYGGGNQFANNLENFLVAKGHQVYRRLVPGLDLILLVSSRSNPVTTAFTPAEAERYLAYYPATAVVHRINDSDEARAADTGIKSAFLAANRCATHTVFVSAFTRDLYCENGFDRNRPHSVIMTGADSAVFNPEGRVEPREGEKLRLVTHHWSSNFLKGFDFYERLDYLLDREPFRSRFEFTCIGNLPLGLSLHNSLHLSPLGNMEIASVLKQQHFYLTGARYESGGNHYIEAMRCGLPVLYLESGSAAEYCAPFGGIGYNPGNFEEKLLEMADHLVEQRAKVLGCPFTAERMAEEYERLFQALTTGQGSRIRLPGRWVGSKYKLHVGLVRLKKAFRTLIVKTVGRFVN